MNCAICNRPLIEGATACIVCGAPVQPPQRIAPTATRPPAGPPPVAPAAPQQYAPQQYGPPQYGPPQYGPPQYGPPQAAPPHYAPPPPVATPAGFAYTPPPAPAPPPGYYGTYGAPPPAATAQPAYPTHPHGASPMQPMFAGNMAANAPNNMAVASFVCGLLGLVPLWIGFALCILAIIFGVLGLQRSDRLPGQRGRGLAIAGLVLGIVFFLPAACGI